MLPHPLAPLLAGFNHLIRSTPAAALRLRTHAGKRIDLSVLPIPRMQWLIDSAGEAMEPATHAPADLTLRAGALGLLAPAASQSERVARFVFEGDPVLAADLRDVLGALRWDIEDDLARVVGDIPARRIASAAATARSQGREAFARLFGNVGEYVAEERKLALSRAQFTAFAQEIEALVSRLDALEQRTDGLRHPGVQ